MASSSDDDVATAALIAQLIAEDLGESYYRYSAPIGASYHDYEEPLSSYERQCLDAENNPYDEGGESLGWGLEHQVDGVAAPDECLGPPDEGTWDSNNEDWDSGYINEEGVREEAVPTQRSEDSPRTKVDEAGEDDSDSISESHTSDKESTDTPARTVSVPAYNVLTNPAGETRSSSTPSTLPTETGPYLWPESTRVLCDHLDPSHHASHREPLIPSSNLAPNESLPASRGWEADDQWDDGLDYSSSKGKGKAVRAYDEFKRGLRDGEEDNWDPNVADLELKEEQDADHDSKDEGEVRDEDLPFVRIPWPSAKSDELLRRHEDAEVVEIHVGDDETLESILRDISLRDERRQKGKAMEGSIEIIGR